MNVEEFRDVWERDPFPTRVMNLEPEVECVCGDSHQSSIEETGSVYGQLGEWMARHEGRCGVQKGDQWRIHHHFVSGSRQRSGNRNDNGSREIE